MKKIILGIGILFFSGAAALPGNLGDSLEAALNKAPDARTRFFLLKELVYYYSRVDDRKAVGYLKNAEHLAHTLNDSAGMAMTALAKVYYINFSGNNDSALRLIERNVGIFQRRGYKKEEAECYNVMGGIYMERGDYRKAIQWLSRSQALALEAGDQKLQCMNLLYSGMSYSQMGERPKGIEMLQQALVLAKKQKMRRTIGSIYIFIGAAYSESASQDYSLAYFKKAQEIALQESDTLMLVEADMYMGNNHYYNKRYEKAIELYSQVAVISERQRNWRVYAGALGNLGNVYADMGQYDKALEHQFRAVPIFTRENDNQGLVICYSAIGSCYYHQKKYTLATAYYQKALGIAEMMNSMEDLIEIHLGYANTMEAMGNYKEAYSHFRMYKNYNDSVYNEGNTKRLTELEMNYRFEAQQKEQQLIQKNKEILADEKLKRQKLLSSSAITGGILLLLLAGLSFRSSRQRKKANQRLQAFNKEVLEQKEVIEYKNQEITDSINYAKRIQESILPLKTEIQQSFDRSFVLFKPRDVVSGDFYWFTTLPGKKIIACVDCTGHGVPGAFMSMIGTAFLNEIVNEKEIVKPAEILNLLHERVRQSLKQDLKNSETRDGMDISICCISNNNTLLEYAGANRSLYIVRKGELIEIKADKQSIGGDQMELDRKFRGHSIPVEEGDSIYMSTDGYADQFGGPKGKKFMVRRFQQTLLEIQHLSMDEQGQLLKRIIEKWQGKTDQVDDILLIGIRL